MKIKTQRSFKPGRFESMDIGPNGTKVRIKGGLVRLSDDGGSNIVLNNDAVEFLKQYLSRYRVEMEKFYAAPNPSPARAEKA